MKIVLDPHAANRPPVDSPASAAFFFESLWELSHDGVGITRESYSRSEQVAIDFVASVAESHGLTVRSDNAANLFITLPGISKDGSFVLCGSHLDSVPHGGNFDGAAGVIAGLICLCKMKNLGVLPRKPIKLVILRGEESAWFGKPCLGSRALLGKLNEADLMLRHYLTNRTLAASMDQVGARTDQVRLSQPLVDRETITAYFELHIEQGPVLVNAGHPVAIVSGIRGNLRHKQIVCRGEAGHSGTVPQSARRDAVLATADLLMRLETHWKQMLQAGHDLVFTAGVIHTDKDQNAITRIPGEVSFSVDIRSQEDETLDTFYQRVREECERIEEERRVTFEFDERLDSRPVLLDRRWIERLQALALSMGLVAPVIPSGAGHDAAQFAEAGVPSAMIFVRNENGSHNPNEAMEIDDFLKATRLLYKALLEAA